MYYGTAFFIRAWNGTAGGAAGGSNKRKGWIYEAVNYFGCRSWGF